MSIMSIYSKEFNKKSVLYKDVNFLLSNYKIIRTLSPIDDTYKIGDCKHLFAKVSDRVKYIKMSSLIDAVQIIISKLDNDKKECQTILQVITAIMNKQTARTIQEDLHISMSTYCKCRFIVVNMVATRLENEG